MILATAVHPPLDVIALINNVVRCHTHMVQTVHDLKVQVAVMDTQNKHLTERVRVLEGDAENKAVADKKQHEDTLLVFSNAVASLESMNEALTGRVVQLERITEEQRITYEKRAEEKRAEEKRAEEKRAEEKRAAELAANQKRTADRCSELLKTHPEFPLHEAARVGDTPDVLDHFLLVLEVPVNTKDTYCITPLHCAASCGHATIVEYLLTKGAEINVKDNNGWTPLHYAALNGNITTVEYLLTKGAEINVKNNDGTTPLHWAARNGHATIVEFLLTKGAEINVKNNHGNTPLHWAAHSGRKDVVALLQTKGGTM